MGMMQMQLDQWQVYRDGEHVAACKLPEDAALLVSQFGGCVMHDQAVVWTEGAEAFGAGESLEGAAMVMIKRRDEAAFGANCGL